MEQILRFHGHVGNDVRVTDIESGHGKGQQVATKQQQPQPAGTVPDMQPAQERPLLRRPNRQGTRRRPRRE